MDTYFPLPETDKDLTLARDLDNEGSVKDGIDRINHVFAYIQGHVPFVIITATRSEFDRSQNQCRNAELVKELENIRLSAFPLCGYWEDEITRKRTKEISFFIPLTKEADIRTVYEFYEFAINWGRRYHQQAFVFSDGSNVYIVLLIDEDGNNILDAHKVGVSSSITAEDLNIVFCKHI